MSERLPPEARAVGSRFATSEEVQSKDFQNILGDLRRIHTTYSLPNYRSVNQARYPWSIGMQLGSEIYASRLWEYPFAILEGQPCQERKCVDIGCGTTAFTLYLRDCSNVVGVDPDIFKSGMAKNGYGASKEYMRSRGLLIVESTAKLADDEFDRVFCISVVEHLPRRKVRSLVQEMTRILKPGGLLITTVDVNIEYDMARPMDLLWESGLVPKGDLSLAWPADRFGLSDDRQSSADVYGLVLQKPTSKIDSKYSRAPGGTPAKILQSQIPHIRSTSEKSVRLPLRLWRHLKAEFLGR